MLWGLNSLIVLIYRTQPDLKYKMKINSPNNSKRNFVGDNKKTPLVVLEAIKMPLLCPPLWGLYQKDSTCERIG